MDKELDLPRFLGRGEILIILDIVISKFKILTCLVAFPCSQIVFGYF